MTHELANLEVTNTKPAPPAATTTAIAETSAKNLTAHIVNPPPQELNMAVQATASAREDFLDVLRQLTQVPSTSVSRRVDTVNVRDFKFPEFQDSKKDASNYIESPCNRRKTLEDNRPHPTVTRHP